MPSTTRTGTRVLARRARRLGVRLLGALALSISCLALALGGLWLGLRLTAPSTYPSALGSVSFQVSAASHGSVELFVPLLDWGLRAHPFSAPLKLHVEPRALNRRAVIAAILGNHRLLAVAERELSADGRQAVKRTIPWLALGVLVAALLGWALLRGVGVRERRALAALPAGVALVALALSAGTLWRAQQSWNAGALAHPAYYARGTEIPELERAARPLRALGGSYDAEIDKALSGDEDAVQSLMMLGAGLSASTPTVAGSAAVTGAPATPAATSTSPTTGTPTATGASAATGTSTPSPATGTPPSAGSCQAAERRALSAGVPSAVVAREARAYACPGT